MAFLPEPVVTFLPSEFDVISPRDELQKHNMQQDADISRNSNFVSVRSITLTSNPLLKCVVCGVFGTNDQFFGKFCSSACVIRSIEMKKDTEKSSGQEASSKQDANRTKCLDVEPQVEKTIEAVHKSLNSDMTNCIVCGKRGNFHSRFCGEICVSKHATMCRNKRILFCVYCRKKERCKGIFCGPRCKAKYEWVAQKTSYKHKLEPAVSQKTSMVVGFNSPRLHAKSVVGIRGRGRGRGRGGRRGRGLGSFNATNSTSAVATCNSLEIPHKTKNEPLTENGAENATDKTKMNLRKLARAGVLTSVYDCIKFLREHRLLAKEMDCSKCANLMREEKTKVGKDNYRWRCQNTCCRTTATIRKGSFFENSRVGLTELILITYFWAIDAPQRQIAYESKVGTQTIVGWANFLREECSSDLKQKKRQIGGPGHVVSIGETQVARRKSGTNAQGRSEKSQWLFGGIDNSTKEVFIGLVPEPGSAPILEELITRHIAKGTTIWSDMFSSYRDIEGLGEDYTHRVVNHSREYTNNIQSLWADIKVKFEELKGVARYLLPSYLDELLWRRQYPGAGQFSEILRAIADNPKYDVTRRIDQ